MGLPTECLPDDGGGVRRADQYRRLLRMSAAPPRFDILGIGNAIVDVVAPVPESFITGYAMAKGSMALIDTATADALYAAMPPGTESSGGSAANTCAVAAMLGAKVAYIGRVADDQLGQVFSHDIGAVGVHFPTQALSGGAPTARCLIMVTPDGQRTMNTYLGACVTLGTARRLSVRPTRGAGRVLCRRQGRPRCWPPSGAVVVRRVLRRPPPRRVPRSRGRACRYPVRQRV
jgi:hypothetical protein